MVTEVPEVPNSSQLRECWRLLGNEAMEVQGSGFTRAALGFTITHTSLLPARAAESRDLPPKAALLLSAPKSIGVIAFKSKHPVCSSSPQCFYPFSSSRQVLKHNSSSNQRLWKSQEKPQNIVKFYRSNKSEVIF